MAFAKEKARHLAEVASYPTNGFAFRDRVVALADIRDEAGRICMKEGTFGTIGKLYPYVMEATPEGRKQSFALSAPFPVEKVTAPIEPMVESIQEKLGAQAPQIFAAQAPRLRTMCAEGGPGISLVRAERLMLGHETASPAEKRCLQIIFRELDTENGQDQPVSSA